MASWICSICGFQHGDFEETCFGCHHSGSSLEQYIDCPTCGRETKAGGAWCDWCQEPLETEEDLDDEDDETTDGESMDDDACEEY